MDHFLSVGWHASQNVHIWVACQSLSLRDNYIIADGRSREAERFDTFLNYNYKVVCIGRSDAQYRQR